MRIFFFLSSIIAVYFFEFVVTKIKGGIIAPEQAGLNHHFSLITYQGDKNEMLS